MSLTLVTSLIGVLESAFTIWVSYDKNKYANQVAAIKAAYYAEINKSDIERSDAILDDLCNQLCIIANSFGASLAAENSAPKS